VLVAVPTARRALRGLAFRPSGLDARLRVQGELIDPSGLEPHAAWRLSKQGAGPGRAGPVRARPRHARRRRGRLLLKIHPAWFDGGPSPGGPSPASLRARLGGGPRLFGVRPSGGAGRTRRVGGDAETEATQRRMWKRRDGGEDEETEAKTQSWPRSRQTSCALRYKTPQVAVGPPTCAPPPAQGPPSSRQSPHKMPLLPMVPLNVSSNAPSKASTCEPVGGCSALESRSSLRDRRSTWKPRGTTELL
jgi:hypothetical protein